MLKISQPVKNGFPEMECMKKLLEYGGESSGFQPVFYDIETTGLSRSRNSLYLVGAVKFAEGSAVLFQWMSQSPDEEPEVLREFSAFLRDSACTLTIQYNGDRFDQPFLEERFKKYGITSPFKRLPSLDLYPKLKPLRGLFGLSHLRQTDLESVLPLSPRRYPDGGACVRLYRSYLKNRGKEAEEAVLGHNAEDVLRLGSIFGLLALLALSEGGYTPVETEIADGRVLFRLRLPSPSPAAFSNGNREFYISVSGEEARLLLPLKKGNLKHFYRNYREYDYIPREDTAIPKVLSRYMDKSLRVPATSETCYTWVSCSEDFLNSPEKQLLYLRDTLPCLLAGLKL